MSAKFICSLLALMLVTACQTTTAAETPAQIDKAKLEDDFFATGWALSDGAVFLYRPGVPYFPDIPMPQKVVTISSVPNNANIVLTEESVTLYSLDTMEIMEPEPAPLPPGIPDVEMAPMDLLPDEYPPASGEEKGPVDFEDELFGPEDLST